ncbi:MAG: hypothetical protein J0M15_16460 [Deltaproteobacteria bacterium]|jgi:hypothetical protein|nr:hypothetical protein [Deltaproteobacteria bacterium]
MSLELKKIGLGTWAFGGRACGPVDDHVSAIKKWSLPPSAIKLIDNLREKYLHILLA